MIAAIVVSYYPDQARLAESLEEVRLQTDAVIIVDNGSPPRIQEWLVQRQGPDVHVLQLPKNQGIAEAQNKGIALAIQLGADFVLLLDQDSRPAQSMVRQLQRGYLALTARGEKVAAIGPCYVDPLDGCRGTFLRLDDGHLRRVACAQADTDEYLRVDITIASGLLIPISALNDIGGMDGGLFIDHVDTDWCLRARSRGYCLYIACVAALSHSLGDAGRRFWLGRWRRLPVHSPARHYYHYRNAVILARRPYAPASWSVHEIVMLALKAASVLVTGPARLPTLAMMTRGLRDGVAGRSGEYPCTARQQTFAGER